LEAFQRTASAAPKEIDTLNQHIQNETNALFAPGMRAA